jgi:hypothetical protein
MRVGFVIVALFIGTMGAAKADCLQEIGQFREQVDAQDQARPTPQSQAAGRELQKLERSESANEVDCYNTLARARKCWRHLLLRQQMIATPMIGSTSSEHHGLIAKS